jgi:hypothetical protein
MTRVRRLLDRADKNRQGVSAWIGSVSVPYTFLGADAQQWIVAAVAAVVTYLILTIGLMLVLKKAPRPLHQKAITTSTTPS